MRYITGISTVTAYEPAVLIPIRSTIQIGQVKSAHVPAAMSASLGKIGNFTAQATLTTLEPGDLIYENELGNTSVLNPGYSSVTVKVDATTSGQLRPGDRVDIYAVNGNQQALLLAANAEVVVSFMTRPEISLARTPTMCRPA